MAGMSRRSRSPAARLAVDPVSCGGVGLCAQLAPGVVELDRWGYPLVADRLGSDAEHDLAVRAVRGCPRRALAVVTAP